MSNNGIAAVVVDDSQFMRTVISDMLDDAGITVVATASNGESGVEAVRTHEPDVVTMDLKMPGMDGIEATGRIMDECPTPVLVLSAHADDGAELTFEAMDEGAVDFFKKPSGEVSVGIKQQQDELVEKVRSVAGADVSATEAAAERTTSTATSTTTSRSASEYVDKPTLVIGSSTGGPTVVEQLLSELPLDADLRILVVQHMPDGFTGRFAKRLDGASEYSVSEATGGERIGGGEALVAQGGYHLEVSGYGGGRLRVTLTEDEPVNNVRPAVDVTLQTAAEQVDGPLTAAILTGMGADGADGVESVSAAGGSVVAQDEETSAVFGMPQRAIETGVVDDVRPRNELADGVLDTIMRE
ncbi:protein-glutamate methylesterase CheB [Natronomonas pharaonis DSM 2160]|uniref:Protein-glutamate methylesterase/protein-glutamine glutaminase n=1 Tax=Natronomonas pharaonis (strain ATCC 35678 / DSM 2160 / CIP 103997 / JCM 8858 / NBRC 14720 / NCIMB 2260 / Gabara) TaxID=348780 RepID=CHEB_NATPD|nr:chemotaxis-specific protein-glutamate methyltransferase CheB [Natronomonas pharaonis]Q3IRR4.1 RecName: Full=Protein-glutamate methylesterase/protein-glutamine glutaminase [Natronomonas pharaonis DSM 2160]CAI49178.1 protein-glutamate methylesterase CheB [Natronomonas pharaonis DSM 2160]